MKKRYAVFYTLIVLLILFLVGLNFITGSTRITWHEIGQILSHQNTQSVEGTILLDIRLPRLLAAFFLGGALALSGYLLQAFFANPIAGPFVLGISSGAKLFVALLMVSAVMSGYMYGAAEMVLAALFGSSLATAFVILAAKRVENMAILMVTGVMIGYICSSVTELLVSFANDSNIVNLHNWSMGTFSSISWKQVRIFIPVVLVGLIISILLSKEIEAYLYGEMYAKSVGMQVRLFRILLIALSSVLSATVTAFAGPISFVGIAVPHLVRQSFRTAKPLIMITASFLGGGAFCLGCDLLARELFAPMELSISTITAILGAPVVISLLIKKKGG
ncbi:iron complex transport system permease protein [Lachnospiraceae bacterium KHCPX20]|nr:iron complex transport system permease protein [Lachnospiraceae bacterium KHCPX20]